METLIELPLILPIRPAITRDPAGHSTYWHSWPLIAWRISGDLLYARQLRRERCRGKTAGGFQKWIRTSIRRLIPETTRIRNENVLIRSLLAMHDHT
jgi:hypothetical protein